MGIARPPHEAMHFRHARLFCEVVSRRSISAAAKACSISQPSASQAIQQLEDELGVSLLDRSNRPLTVTPAGERYAIGCRDLLGRVAELEDEVRAIGHKLAGEVRVAAIYSVSMLEVRTLGERFQQQHPDVSVTFEFCHPSGVYERLRDGLADLGLIAFPRDGGEFESRPWQRQPFAVVLPPEHGLAGRSRLKPDELAGQPFVALSEGLRTRQHVDRLLRKRGVAVQEVGQFDNFDTLRRAVSDGGGLTIAPAAIFEKDAQRGVVAIVPLDVGDEPDAGDWVRPLGIVSRASHGRGRSLTAAAEAFARRLQEAAARKADRRKPSASPGVAAQRCDEEVKTEMGASVRGEPMAAT